MSVYDPLRTLGCSLICASSCSGVAVRDFADRGHRRCFGALARVVPSDPRTQATRANKASVELATTHDPQPRPVSAGRKFGRQVSRSRHVRSAYHLHADGMGLRFSLDRNRHHGFRRPQPYPICDVRLASLAMDETQLPLIAALATAAASRWLEAQRGDRTVVPLQTRTEIGAL